MSFRRRPSVPERVQPDENTKFRSSPPPKYTSPKTHRPHRPDATTTVRRLSSLASTVAAAAPPAPAPAPAPEDTTAAMAEPASKKAKTGAGLFDLTGKVAVVTGGTGVLGSEMCKGLAAAGCKVAVMGRRVDAAAKVVDEITAAGGIAMALPGDVTDPASVDAARDALVAAYGTIDILVNAAGGNQPGATIGPDDSFFEKFDLGAFEQISKLNLNGTILPCKVFGAIMAEKKNGSIVNISSMAAQAIITRVCGYSASKAAVDNFTAWLAVELATKVGAGLRVNAIAPGCVRSLLGPRRRPQPTDRVSPPPSPPSPPPRPRFVCEPNQPHAFG
eukprot:SAG22_NODE_4362_length_1292_cov_2.293378_1_plen_332_part_00